MNMIEKKLQTGDPHGYYVYEAVEHCHRCGTYGRCVVRYNRIRPTNVRKTSLCSECAAKEQDND